MSDECPSCGYKKEHPDKPLCFYCYHRGTTGALKMMILDILDKASERLTTDELLEKLNALPDMEKKMTRDTLKDRMTYYKKLKIITGRRERKKRKGGGRPKYLWKITERGKKRLASYKKRWLFGQVVQIRSSAKNFRLTQDYKARASNIRGRVGKEYDSYKYILPDRRKID